MSEVATIGSQGEDGTKTRTKKELCLHCGEALHTHTSTVYLDSQISSCMYYTALLGIDAFASTNLRFIIQAAYHDHICRIT